jgi:hypothetical protein
VVVGAMPVAVAGVWPADDNRGLASPPISSSQSRVVSTLVLNLAEGRQP